MPHRPPPVPIRTVPVVMRAILPDPGFGRTASRPVSSSPALRGHAPVAQWIEHLTTDQKVGGSSPFGRTSQRRTAITRCASLVPGRRRAALPGVDAEEDTRRGGGPRSPRGDEWRRAVRRRRLIFRSTVVVLALGAVVGLVIPMTGGGQFGVGPALLAMVLAAVALAEAGALVGAIRDRSAPERPPSHTWWVCELPVDHPFVLVAASTADNPTWRCRRCGT